jgi:hypothetical protein
VNTEVVDWRPSSREGLVWNVLALPLLFVGLIGFGWLAIRDVPTSGSATVGATSLLLWVLGTLALAVALFLAHEGLHGLVMAAFGGRPRFGAMMMARVVPVLYTTAPGHVFSGAQYLAVSLTPAAAISILGVAACLTPAGLIFVVPLAIHLSGCVGDFAATLRLLAQPRGTSCEDLPDGLRFHRPSAVERQ